MPTKYRVSGHESFPCRYTWLPKTVRELKEEPRIFAADEEENTMVRMGVGKNMVRSARFWAQAAGVAQPAENGAYRVTAFAERLLGNGGFDEFLEDVSTLWLLHWHLCADATTPLLAWDFLVSRFQDPDFTASKAIEVLDRELKANDIDLSPKTIEQHVDVFIHTYVPTRGRKGAVQEDNLDSPFVELDFLEVIGSADNPKTLGRSEPIYAFRREEKYDIRPEVFAYCVHEYWQNRLANNHTMQLKDLAHGFGSPGQVFKLPEEDVRERAGTLQAITKGFYRFAESALQPQIQRDSKLNAPDFLALIYDEATV